VKKGNTATDDENVISNLNHKKPFQGEEKWIHQFKMQAPK
jgi:hypothetical protein